MRPSRFTRLFWLLQDIWELSPLARMRSRVHALRHARGAKAVAGLLVALLVVVAGFAAARMVAHSPNIASPQSAPRVVTVQRRVLRRVEGRPGSRQVLRTVYAHGRTVVRSAAPRTANSVRLVTAPAAGTRGETRTVVAPVTDTVTRTSTRLVTVTHPVTVVATTTVVSIETVSVPVTVTVTLP